MTVFDAQWESQRYWDKKTADWRRAGQALAELPPAVGTASTKDGSVTVDVGAGGELRSVRLTHRAMKLGPEYLSQTVLSVAARATALANRQAHINFATVFGADTARHLDAFGQAYDSDLIDEDTDESNDPMRYIQ